MSSSVAGGRGRRSVAVIGGVVSVVLLVGGCADAGSDEEPEKRSFGLQGRTLKIDSNDSALELVVAGDAASKKRRVEVTRWFAARTALGGEASVDWEMKGDTLKLRTKCPRLASDCDARHRVEIPRDVKVSVVNGDGSVSAHGLRSALKVRSDDGSVTVREAGGPLDLRSADGKVEAHDITSRAVAARSGDGRVELGFAETPDRVEARSGDGSVTVEVPRGKYRVDADSGDGSVDVSVPRDAAGKHAVTAHSDDGSVTVRENEG